MESDLSLVKTKLSLHWHIAMNECDLKSPLQWQKDHEKQFPNVAVFA
jgi:hypothetical protein